MTHLIRLLRILPLLALPVLSVPLTAEDTSAQPEVAVFTIKFEGGTLNDLEHVIEESIGDRLNFVLGPRTHDLPVPPFNLQAVTVRDLAKTLEVLLPQTAEIGWTESGLDYALPVLTVVNHQKTPVSSPKTITQAFALAEIVDLSSAEKITASYIAAAIREAWLLDPNRKAEDLRLKLHQSTELLIVNGPPEAINITENVLGSIQRSIIFRKNAQN